MAARKSVKNITASIDGTDAPVYSATVVDGRTTTNGEIAAYGDTLFTTAASPVLHAADLTIDVLDEGTLGSTLAGKVGQTVAVSITVAYGDGSGTTPAGSNIIGSGNCVILSVTGDSVPVDSDGRSIIHVTLRKQA